MERRGKIVVLDFGGQYAHLIARRLRELGVYSEILLPNAETKELKKAKGIILSGGPTSVYKENAPEFNTEIFSLKKPLLGICYGHQLMAKEMGGEVRQGRAKEYGSSELILDKTSKLFKGLGKTTIVWMSHGDTIVTPPSGFRKIGNTFDCEFAAMENPKKKMYGLQFHPEVAHTEQGMRILKNFVFGICKAKKNWGIGNFLRQKIREIKKQVGKKDVFMLASGGIDSTVCLALFAKALKPRQVFALHVDTGFMRKNESVLVEKALRRFGLELKVLNASKEFFSKLKGVSDPEEKRKIIGELFVRIANREIKKIATDESQWLLGQGTIYPDTIETGRTKHSTKIKTHHNRVESIQQLIKHGRIIEPLDQLYKDEVRELGRRLGLEKELINRHPFPGPGLAIRCLCSNRVKEEISAEAEKKAKEIAIEFGFNAVVLPVKAVGVQGDSRTYSSAVALTGPLEWEKIENCSTRITNEIREFNRVVFLVEPQQIESIKLKKAFLTKKRITLLQEADVIVMEEIAKAGLMGEIWQFPVVLLPLDVNGIGEAVVLRPVSSREAMTARFYPMENEVLEGIAKKIGGLKGIGAVLYDVTHKPPATIEWE